MAETMNLDQNFPENDPSPRDGDEPRPFDLKTIREQLTLAETLAQVHLLTGPEVKMRIAAKSMALKFGYTDECGGFVPPKELLLYMVRLFNGVPTEFKAINHLKPFIKQVKKCYLDKIIG